MAANRAADRLFFIFLGAIDVLVIIKTGKNDDNDQV
jgi:hypothetical protein